MSNYDYNQIEQYFLNFARSALACLETQIGEKEYLRRVDPFTVFLDNGDMQHNLREQLVLRDVVNDAREKLLTLTEARFCAEAHLLLGQIPPSRGYVGGVGSEAPPPFEAEYPELLTKLLAPCLTVVEEANTFHPTDDQLLFQYRRYLNSWTATYTDYNYFVPLIGLDGDIAATSIGNSMQLAPFKGEEKTDLWSWFHGIFMPLTTFARAKYRIKGEFRKEASKTIAPYEIVDNEAGKFITALRLHKPGDIGAIMFFLRSHQPAIGDRMSSVMENMDIPNLIAPKYILAPEDLSDIIELYHKLDKMTDKALETTLRRFNQAYTRKLGEDKIIDLTISLESSLLHKIEDELKYRLALRGAALLAPVMPPEDARQLLSLMYDVRSKIVHEGMHLADIGQKSTSDISKKWKSIKPGTHIAMQPDACEDLVRQVVRQYIGRMSSNVSVEKINKDLDARIISGLETSSPSQGQDPTAS